MAEPKEQWRRWAALAVPVVLAAYLYRRSFRIWFLADDFAWLGLRLSVANVADLWTALFQPMAQGTVRVLSERLFFLGFESWFGLESLPMRVWTFLTLAGALVMMAKVVEKLTGNLRAGVLAAILWSLNFGVTVAMAWLSSYNQILLSFLVLVAVWAWLEDRLWLCWGAYLLGFGTLESVIVLPVILVLARPKDWRRALPMFVPAAAFTYAHLFLIPKTQSDPSYRMHFDASLLDSVGVYWSWLLAAARLQAFDAAYAWTETPVLWLVTPTYFGFVAWKAWRREFVPLFGLGMSLLLLAPMLPLRDHRTDYYLASASMGVMMGLALLPFELPRPWGRSLGMLAVGLYAIPSFLVQAATFEWYLERSGPVRVLVRGLRYVAAKHEGKQIVLEGISNDLYYSALADDALRLVKAEGTRLVPGTGPEGSGAAIPPQALRVGLERERVRVYRLDGAKLYDVTRRWERGAGLELAEGLSPEVAVGEPEFATQLGEGWFAAEGGKRWMGRRAVLRLAVDGVPGNGKLIEVQAYVPAVMAGATLTLRAGERDLGTRVLAEGELVWGVPLGAMSGEFAAELVCSKTVRAAGDDRDLSLLVTRVRVR